MIINQPVCEGGGHIGSDSLLRKVQVCLPYQLTSRVFHVLNSTGRMTTQKLSTVMTACDTTEADEEDIDLFEKCCCSKASVVHVT